MKTYTLEKFASGRWTVRNLSGLRCGEVIGGSRKYMPLVGGRQVGLSPTYHSKDAAALVCVQYSEGRAA